MAVETKEPEKVIVDNKVMCICGKEPEMAKTCGDNGSSYNGCAYVLECPSCGDKGQEPLKSQMMAISVWESRNWKKRRK